MGLSCVPQLCLCLAQGHLGDVLVLCDRSCWCSQDHQLLLEPSWDKAGGGPAVAGLGGRQSVRPMEQSPGQGQEVLWICCAAAAAGETWQKKLLGAV